VDEPSLSSAHCYSGTNCYSGMSGNHWVGPMDGRRKLAQWAVGRAVVWVQEVGAVGHLKRHCVGAGSWCSGLLDGPMNGCSKPAHEARTRLMRAAEVRGSATSPASLALSSHPFFTPSPLIPSFSHPSCASPWPLTHPLPLGHLVD